MKRLVQYFAMLPMVLLAACSEDALDVNHEVPTGRTLTLTATGGVASRTVVGNDESTELLSVNWESGDAIGVYFVNGTSIGNETPIQFTTSETDGDNKAEFTTDDTNVPADGTYTVYAVYPYDASATLSSQSFDFSEVTDNKGAAPMWAKSENATVSDGKLTSSLSFRQIASLLELNITNPTQEAKSITKVTLLSGASSIASTATLNAATGEWTRGTVTYPATLALSLTGGGLSVVANASVKAYLPFVPGMVDDTQTPAVYETDGKGMSIAVTTGSGDDAFTYTTAKTGIGFDAGKCYAVSLSLNAGNEKGIETVLVKAGTFQMGSPTDEVGHLSDETQHKVTLTQDFYLGKYEVTNAQYCEFLNDKSVGSDGKYTLLEGDVTFIDEVIISQDSWGVTFNTTNSKWEPQSGYDNHPVICVSWYGAYAFAKWVGGTLPTEAQWEYACRAGTTTSWSFGGSDTNMNDYAWYSDNGESMTHVVGGKTANAWGLYDMHGNVWEWCMDCYGTYETGANGAAIENPTGVADGFFRMFRGGAWNNGAQICRSACRYFYTPGYRSFNVGFRVAFPVP